MQKHCGKKSWMTVLTVLSLATVAFAQDVPSAAKSANKGGRSPFGFMAVLERKVGLTPEQRDSVRGLLAEQRQKSAALREETDGKIRAILNRDQQEKFDEVLADQKARFGRRSQGA